MPLRTLLALCLSCLAACRAPLVVASDLDNLPFAGVDEEGTPIGRDVEMMEALAEELGRPLRWERMPFDALLDAVERGEVDVVCATLGHTPERAARVGLSRPYYRTELAVVVRDASTLDPSRLATEPLRIAGAAGTTSERAIRTLLPRATFVATGKDGRGARELLVGAEVDAVVMDGPAATALAERVPASFEEFEGRSPLAWKVRVLAEPLAREDYVLAVRPDDPALLAALDAALATLEAGGTLGALDTAHRLDSPRR